MANEAWNGYRHNAGFLHFDWDYFHDASVDQGAANYRAASADGITPQEVVNLVQSAADGDQITDREARQIYGELQRSTNQMSAEARTVAFDAMDRLDDAYPGVLTGGGPIFRQEWAVRPLIYQDDSDYRTAVDTSNINGLSVTDLLTHLQIEAASQPYHIGGGLFG